MIDSRLRGSMIGGAAREERLRKARLLKDRIGDQIAIAADRLIEQGCPLCGCQVARMASRRRLCRRCGAAR